jgi:outer membrane protein insertion porin family/translocation and assembly module TamA
VALGAGRGVAQGTDGLEPGPVIRGLDFTGNDAYPAEILETVIATTNSSWFARAWGIRALGLGEKRRLDELEFRRDVLRLTAYYREGGYLEVQVDTAVRRAPDGVRITFAIREGRPVRVDTFTVTGLAGLPRPLRAGVVEDLPLAVGDPFDRRAMLAASDSIAARLRNAGRPSVEVYRSYEVDRARRRARVRFEVDTGAAAVVGPVRISGTDEVDSALVRRLLATHPGERFEEGDLYESQRILYRTELFRFASVEVDTTRFAPGDTVVPLAVHVREAPFRRVRAAVGYGTNDCLRGGAAWTARNWLGGGRVLELSARASKVGVGAPTDWGLERSLCRELKNDPIGSELLNYSNSVSLRHPGFLSPANTQTTALFAERRSEWDVYRREEYGGSFSLRRETSRRIPVTASYRLAWGQTTAPSIVFCAYFNACTAGDISALSQRRRLATLSALVSIPRANDPLNATRGHNFSFEAVWSDRLFGSDPLQEFTRLQADLAWYRPLSREVTLSWHVRGGLLFSPRAAFDSTVVAFVPPDQRFYAGGPNDVRGFDRNELGPVVYVIPDSIAGPGGAIPPDSLHLLRSFPSGGNTLVVGNVEVRIPSPIWPERFRLALFADAGALWQRGETDLAPPKLYVTPGAGLRIATPLGPARIDVGYNPYPRTQGPLYEVNDARELTLIASDFSAPRSHRYSIHISVGQPF